VNLDNLITRLLSTPIRPDWTVDELAEEVLGAIAGQPTLEGHEIILDASAMNDRQSQRILRPLLACLATKSAAETASSPDLYGGSLCFKRTGPEGPVWIFGQFDNRHGMVRAFLRRSARDPQNSESKPAQSKQESCRIECPSACRTGEGSRHWFAPECQMDRGRNEFVHLPGRVAGM
jgi:hypothetical protein